MLEKLRNKLVEMISGLVMVIGGTLIAVFVPEPWVKAIAAATSALGGALISWSTAVVETRDDAREVLKPNLEALSRTLATTTGQITTAVQAVSLGIQEPKTGIALISQSTSGLYGLVNELQILADSQFESANLLETVNTCEEMAKDLSDRLSSLSHDEIITKSSFRAVLDDLESLKMQLGSAKREMEEPTRRLVSETIPCLECNEPVKVQIGTVPGDSATPTCLKCGTRFHAHRDSSGDVFSRRWGGQSGSIVRAIACPKCGVTFDARLSLGDSGKMLYCLECYERIYVNSDGRITKHEESMPLDAAALPGDGWRSNLKCPICEIESLAFVKEKGNIYAVCSLCKDLLICRTDSE